MFVGMFYAFIGIGMKKSHEDDWISHQDDFNALLSQLNQGMCHFYFFSLSKLEV